jgi:type II secretory pathway pseudopilin PulG
MSIARSKGFTLVETLVSFVILTVGIASIIGAFGQMDRARGRAIETERMQRLAFDKYDELVGTGDYTLPALSGDFKDRSEDRYTWRAELLQTGTSDLESLTVYVEAVANSDKLEQITGLIYTPPTTGTGSSGGSTNSTSTRSRGTVSP